MTQPYFSIDEEVILQSRNHPQYNGDNVVEKIITPGTKLKSGLGVYIGIQYGIYGIDLGKDSDGDQSYFNQSALRKKHKPSDESFSELMTNYRTVKVQP
jgi:hypothetical protein